MGIVRDGLACRISDKKEMVAILLIIVVGVVVCVAMKKKGSQNHPTVIPTRFMPSSQSDPEVVPK